MAAIAVVATYIEAKERVWAMLLSCPAGMAIVIVPSAARGRSA